MSGDRTSVSTSAAPSQTSSFAGPVLQPDHEDPDHAQRPEHRGAEALKRMQAEGDWRHDAARFGAWHHGCDQCRAGAQGRASARSPPRDSVMLEIGR